MKWSRTRPLILKKKMSSWPNHYRYQIHTYWDNLDLHYDRVKILLQYHFYVKWHDEAMFLPF